MALAVFDPEPAGIGSPAEGCFYNGEVDGVIGDGTRVALEQYFRREADLAAQGIVSDSTIGLFANNPR